MNTAQDHKDINPGEVHRSVSVTVARGGSHINHVFLDYSSGEISQWNHTHWDDTPKLFSKDTSENLIEVILGLIERELRNSFDVVGWGEPF